MIFALKLRQIKKDDVSGLLCSANTDNVRLIKEVCRDLGVEITNHSNFIKFLLALQETDFQFAFLEFDQVDFESMNQVKIIKKTGPKISLIIICNEISKNTGGLLYSEGIFFILNNPLGKSMLTSVIKSAAEFKARTLNSTKLK